MDTCRKIGLQLKSNLESNWIWTLLFLYSIIYLAVGTKLKIKWDKWCKIENLIEPKSFAEICILFFTCNEFLNITLLTYFICLPLACLFLFYYYGKYTSMLLVKC